MMRRIRVLAAKPGLDGHDRGIKVVASVLKDAGMEVIYTGLRQTAEQIVKTAMEEHVDVVAISILSGAHDYILPRLMELMRENGLEKETLVIVGGIIPEEDIVGLKNIGVSEIFGPGTITKEIVTYICDNIKVVN